MMPKQSRDPEEGLRGRVAVVTGASRRTGIGAAICRALARRGADVFFTQWGAYDQGPGIGEDSDGPADLRQQLRSLDVRAEYAEADLSLPETPARVLEEASGRLGVPSILVNNAAHSARDGFENLDATTLDAHYVVNLRATALLSVEFARRYPGGSGGRIISMTSGQENGPMPGEHRAVLLAAGHADNPSAGTTRVASGELYREERRGAQVDDVVGVKSGGVQVLETVARGVGGVVDEY